VIFFFFFFIKEFVRTYSFVLLQILRVFCYIAGFRQNVCLNARASPDCRLCYSLKGM